MWKRTPISTPTILGIILALLLMIWRKDQGCRFQTLESELAEKSTLIRILLGVPPDSPSQTVTITKPPSTSESSGPDETFGDLPMDADLIREFEEFRAKTGTLSGRPARTSPGVEQKDLASPSSWPSATESAST